MHILHLASSSYDEAIHFIQYLKGCHFQGGMLEKPRWTSCNGPRPETYLRVVYHVNTETELFPRALNLKALAAENVFHITLVYSDPYVDGRLRYTTRDEVGSGECGQA